MPPDTTSNISRLSELLAAHGVYALTIIFIFYQQSRAARSLKTADPQDHNYFKKVHASVVALTYVLVALSSAVWIYATFVYIPKPYVRGSVLGLTDQAVRPQKDGDPPRISEIIAPEAFDADLYQSKRIKDDNSSDEKYDLGWVLLPHDNVHSLVFRFQHRYERVRPTARMLFNRLSSPINIERNLAERRFRVDLRKIHYSPGGLIELMYQPNPENPTEKIGNLYLKDPETSNAVPIPWEEITSARTSVELEKSLFPKEPFVVYASSSSKSPFKENGDYDPQFGRVLRQRLADPDLKTQLTARSVLVENGSRSFKFILDTLKMSFDANEGGALLASNLGHAVMEMESRGSPAPREIYLDLAIVFGDVGDNQSSAQFFDKATEKPDDPAVVNFRRGLAYYLTDNYDAAVRNMNAVLKAGNQVREQSLVHVVLGISYGRLGRDLDAIAHYQKAISLEPTQPMAYNGLAYLYAERGKNLQEALRLVDRALALEKNPDDIANYKDTKGWILYRMGRQDEAFLLIKEAAARLPSNPEIQDHLKQIQANARGHNKN